MSPFSPRILRSVSATAGFTLMEMVITLAIFVMLAGAVFGIITGVLEGASSLQDNQNHHDQVEALKAFLKKKLEELPAGSSFISYQRGNGEGLTQNGIIFGRDDDVTAVDAKVQDNGYYTLRLATYDPAVLPANGPAQQFPVFESAIIANDPNVVWTPLIRDIKLVDWKFEVLDDTDWLEVWTDTSHKPNLFEFSMQLAGDLQPITMDFWFPRLDPVTLSLPAPTTTNAH